MSFAFRSLADTEMTVFGHNDTDSDGNPTGGYSTTDDRSISSGRSDSLYVRWQDGPVNRAEGEKPNGAFVEDVLEVCRLRLAFCQDSKLSCDDNAEAV